MSVTKQEIDMPSNHFKKIIKDIIKENSIESHRISVTKGIDTGENYLGDIFRVTIEDREKRQLKMIAKCALSSPEVRQVMNIHNIYSRECLVYSKLHPTLKSIQDSSDLEDNEKYHYAKLYKCHSKEPNEILVLEDLSAKGFVMRDRHLSLDKDHITICVKNLARYHAATIVLKDRMPEIYEEMVKTSLNIEIFRDFTRTLIDKSKGFVVSLCKDESYSDKVMEFYDTMHEEMMKCFDSEMTAPYNVICHGDCWSNNFLFKYEHYKPVQVIMVDYQLMKLATPIIDIAHMLFLGIDKETRAKHYQEMLKLYYETLSYNVTKMGVDIKKYYPESIYWDHVKKYMKIGLIKTIYITPMTKGNKGEAVDLNDLAKKDDCQSSMHTTKRIEKWVKDVIEDCIEYGIL